LIKIVTSPDDPSAGNPDRENIQAVIQIFPESFGLHFFSDILIGSSNDPHVHLQFFSAADFIDLSFLNEPQQLGLG